MPRTTRRPTDHELCVRIRTWITSHVTRSRDTYGPENPQFTERFDRLMHESLRIGPLKYTDMENSPKYSLPLKVQIIIVRFMRRRNTLSLQKSSNRTDLYDLYREIGLRTGPFHEDALVQADFLRLLERKVDNCIRAKAVNMRPWCRVLNGNKGEVEDWHPYSCEWLDDGWDGRIKKFSSIHAVDSRQEKCVGRSVLLTNHSADMMEDRVESTIERPGYIGPESSPSNTLEDSMSTEDATMHHGSLSFPSIEPLQHPMLRLSPKRFESSGARGSIIPTTPEPELWGGLNLGCIRSLSEHGSTGLDTPDSWNDPVAIHLEPTCLREGTEVPWKAHIGGVIGVEGSSTMGVEGIGSAIGQAVSQQLDLGYGEVGHWVVSVSR